MAQEAKCWLCKNQELSADPQNLLKLGTAASIFLELVSMQDRRKSGSLRLASLAKTERSRSRKRPCLKNKVDSDKGRHLILIPGLHRCITDEDMHAHTHKNSDPMLLQTASLKTLFLFP